MIVELTGIPVLETERLVLRAPKAVDAEGYVAFMMSERSRHVGGPLARNSAWRAFSNEIGHWLIRGFGMWAVTQKGDDTCLGYVGCWYPEGWNEHEIGWQLWPAAEGNGFAHEAALATRAFAYRTLGWTTAISNIEPQNKRSIRLAERLGAVLDPKARPIDPGDLVYRHPSPGDL